MSRSLRVACFAFATCLAAPSVAVAKNDDEGRPWARGTWAIGPGIGFGFGSDITSLSFGLGGEYYVLNGWSLGADVSDTVFIYSSALRSEFPGIEKELATNAFFFIPQSRYVFYRSYRFSPWVRAGVGPVALNHGGGAAGQWVAEPGVFIGLAGPVYLKLGVTFSSIFTRDVCESAFTSVAADGSGVQVGGVCGFQWSPGIGIVIAPRAKTRRERRREEDLRRAPPPRNPMRVEAPPEPEPEPEPAVTTEPTPPDEPTTEPVPPAEPSTEPVPPAEPVPPVEPAPPAEPAPPVEAAPPVQPESPSPETTATPGRPRFVAGQSVSPVR